MHQAMHAARLAAAHDALLALFVEQRAQELPAIDGLSVHFVFDDEEPTIDITYTRGGQPVSGEGA